MRTKGRMPMMTVMEAITARHSVRRYLDTPVPHDVAERLSDEAEACNRDSGMSIQIVFDDPRAFGGVAARCGRFRNVRNYIALVGPDTAELDETAGYQGERLVLLAQALGLNTCWVALTYSKRGCSAKVGEGERTACVISLGYGETQGIQHKSRPMGDVCRSDVDMPEWFQRGVEAALLAPTAMNQQKFMIELADGKVSARSTGGFYSEVDLGIVKYHFEAAAGKDGFEWALPASDGV